VEGFFRRFEEAEFRARFVRAITWISTLITALGFLYIAWFVGR